MPKYPVVNYIGNKEKIADWICDLLPSDSNSLFDAFSGGCSISYEAKLRGFQVYSNDVLEINFHIANALIKNNDITLNKRDIDLIFGGTPFKGFMFKNYSNTFYFEDECKELDLYRQNIENLDSDFKKSLALVILRRAMIRKMPYSRYTIKWDKILQLRDEEYSYKKYKRRRAYHNKSFKYHFLENLEQYNSAVFNNDKQNFAYNSDIFSLIESLKTDVIYLDPPYAGTMNNYFGFYGLLDNYISSSKKSPFINNFRDKDSVVPLFHKLFSNLSNFKYWYLSYNNTSYPTKSEMLEIIKQYSNNVEIKERKHNYQITGKKKKQVNNEYLFIVKNF